MTTSEPLITQAGDGVFIVDGKAEIDEVAKLIGEDFAAGEHGEYVDTIGGMIFNALGRVPARGEVVQADPGLRVPRARRRSAPRQARAHRRHRQGGTPPPRGARRTAVDLTAIPIAA